MALQKNISLQPLGINTTVDSYSVIERISITRMPHNTGNQRTAQAMVLTYASKAARDAGAQPIGNETFEFIFDKSDERNILTIAYINAKNNPHFSGALDV